MSTPTPGERDERAAQQVVILDCSCLRRPTHVMLCSWHLRIAQALALARQDQREVDARISKRRCHVGHSAGECDCATPTPEQIATAILAGDATRDRDR